MEHFTAKSILDAAEKTYDVELDVVVGASSENRVQRRMPAKDVLSISSEGLGAVLLKAAAVGSAELVQLLLEQGAPAG